MGLRSFPLRTQRCPWRHWLLAALLLGGSAAGRFRLSAEPAPAIPLHLAFSSTTFGEVNQNDAIATLKIWVEQIALDNSINVKEQPCVLNGVEPLRAALREKRIDAANVTTDEYQELKDYFVDDRFILGIRNGTGQEEFIVLVRQDSGLNRLSDLRGRTLVVLNSPRMRLAPIWLETQLAHEQLGKPQQLFRTVTVSPKPSQVVLPVFFSRADACIITRRGFDIMRELNPQLGRELKVLASSPPVVPFLFAFRRDYSSPLQDKIYDNAVKWHTSERGKQILTVFQCDRLEIRPFSDLAETLALIAEHNRVCGPEVWRPESRDAGVTNRLNR